ncbi:MAG: assimilatory sulfite reductase (NADPH) flavoprotein subunit [Verrucomicrobiaceae bacterium]|nr:assimilatory sulfite reductase (NADPH) flavoprotein subunit [Verrucomicrobiaceae bacterium]
MSFPNLTPLNPEQQSLVGKLAAELNRDQALWLAGFFAGLGSANATADGGLSAMPPVLPSAEKRKLTILYGTESGNSEKLASAAAKTAAKYDFKVTLANMAEARLSDLGKGENLLVIVSTWGEGDPPEAATSYYEGFMSGAMPQLPGLRYSVCGLGDTSYEHFCKMGKDFDTRLAELGAIRVYDRAECDVDYQATFDCWLSGALNAFPEPESVTITAPLQGPVATSVVYDKANPYSSEILQKIVLNGTGSNKEVLHLELSLEGSGLVYEPGDALGIYPENRASDIDGVLAATGLSANAKLGDKTLGDALRHDFDITTLAPTLADKFNAIVGDASLKTLLDAEGRAELKSWIAGRQLIDLLEAYPYKSWTPESFTGILRKLTPRLYSIASSLKKHEDEVHLTIAAVRYHTHDRDRTGVASCYVADDVAVGDRIRVFLHHNNNFRLPEHDAIPVIMIGPGTGIAPFRAFIEERSARGAKGKNWLFFGEQHFSYDFLYQLEWLDYLEEGTLSELSLAFSRDQKEKIYVQDRLVERGAEIYQWLESGAHLYVCGDASRMAKDVQQALLGIIAEHGGKTPVEAKAYLDALRKAKRYQRDVY